MKILEECYIFPVPILHKLIALQAILLQVHKAFLILSLGNEN